ncbi:glycosyltransferase [Endozoicomonas sp. ALC020]|uniref:glycosyltransferase n=1 Tax=unclassified Endozoicomonas TaxID=2644528 RepID=UPI003BAE288B
MVKAKAVLSKKPDALSAFIFIQPAIKNIMPESILRDIKNSDLFDAEWYLEQYPDVKKANLCPANHYANLGWRIGRNPSQKFNTAKYLEHHPDVCKAGINPLVHFIRCGSKEGRITFPLPKNQTVNSRPSLSLNYENKYHLLNDYFDNVYVVNLEKSVKEKLRISKHLKIKGVNFQFWNAVNGYEGEPLKKYEEYKKRQLGSLIRYKEMNEREIWRGKGFIESAGAVGYIYTYINIMKDALEKGYDKFLILEDDIILSNNFETDFQAFLNKIDPDWKVIQLGASQYGWNSVELANAEKDGFYYPRQLDTCGSFAIGLRGNILSELIEAESAFEAPFDHLPMGEIYERYLGKCFVSYPNIVMPDVTDSNIRDGRDQLQHAEKMRWVPENFEFPLPSPSVSVLIQSAKSLKYASLFSKAKVSTFNLRLYALSDDGLRPIHNFDNLTWIGKHSCNKDIYYPDSDYWVTIGQNDVLYEEDIEKYILEKQLGSDSYIGALKEHKVRTIEVVPGRVSVIIPTYKRPKNLRNALNSVAEQRFSNKEILVINDTGQESKYNHEIRAIVNKIKIEFPDVLIKFIEHKKNRNGASARNTGILASTGEYISFLDDDDIYLPGRLEKSVAFLEKQGPIVGGVYCGFIGWNSPKNDINRYTAGDLTKELLLLEYSKHYLHTNTATYKRSSVFSINGFDESYRRHQDFEFNLRFFEKYKVEVVTDSLVKLNPEPSDISNKVFNIDMLLLKKKFLEQFSATIASLGEHNEREVYKMHWSEVIKYASDVDSLKAYINQTYSNAELQVSLLTG